MRWIGADQENPSCVRQLRSESGARGGLAYTTFTPDEDESQIVVMQQISDIVHSEI